MAAAAKEKQGANADRSRWKMGPTSIFAKPVGSRETAAFRVRREFVRRREQPPIDASTWFHSTVGPDDIVSVIGEFSNQGECIIDYDRNLVIIHPELLISGTWVASSFHCPRRSILDERLKSTEFSMSALMGTMLHQVFQAGLLEDVPSRHFFWNNKQKKFF